MNTETTWVAGGIYLWSGTLAGLKTKVCCFIFMMQIPGFLNFDLC